jgi:hypothetical protein
MNRPKLEVADIFRRYGEGYRRRLGASLSTAQRRVMKAVEICRTSVLGGHVEQCDGCGHQRVCYSSCRNRACPKCQFPDFGRFCTAGFPAGTQVFSSPLRAASRIVRCH